MRDRALSLGILAAYRAMARQFGITCRSPRYAP